MRKQTRQLILLTTGFMGLNLTLLSHKLTSNHPTLRLAGLVLALACFYPILKKTRGHAIQIKSNAPLTHLLPPTGALIIASVLIYNLSTASITDLKSFDQIVILLGLLMLAYPKIPSPYHLERDFGILFLTLLTLILIAPSITYQIISPQSQEELNTPFIYHLLANPTAKALKLTGLQTNAQGRILYISPATGTPLAIDITLACSGLYSFAMFLSAYLAFITIRYQKITKQTIILALAGTILLYLANLLRTIILAYIAHIQGKEAFTWAHANLGWLLFTGFSILFFTQIIKYLPGENQ